MSVLLHALDTPVQIQRGTKLGFALPMSTDYEEKPNQKKYRVINGATYANKDLFSKVIDELKSNKTVSMRSEIDGGLPNRTSFPEQLPSSYEFVSNNPVLPELEHLKGKIRKAETEMLEGVNRMQTFFKTKT